MLIVVVPYPEKIPEGFNPENYGWVKKTMLKVHEPMRIKEQLQNPTVPTFFVTSKNIENIKSKHDQRVQRTSEEIREQANTFFKAKKYIKAIHLYENALASIHKPDCRKMSVLYSNAAACLFELQLYNSCIMLSDIAIMVDPVYNKGYYRKLRSLF